jgi:hypothetical protein
MALGLEGIVAKDQERRPYVEGPGITRYWLKIKNPSYERKEPIEFKPQRRR